MASRGTTPQRGYGYEHRQIRAAVKRTVDAGDGYCWRCGAWLDPNRPWDLGHDDNDRSVYRGAECVPCNRATAGRQARRVWNIL